MHGSVAHVIIPIRQEDKDRKRKRCLSEVSGLIESFSLDYKRALNITRTIIIQPAYIFIFYCTFWVIFSISKMLLYWLKFSRVTLCPKVNNFQIIWPEHHLLCYDNSVILKSVSSVVWWQRPFHLFKSKHMWAYFLTVSKKGLCSSTVFNYHMYCL